METNTFLASPGAIGAELTTGFVTGEEPGGVRKFWSEAVGPLVEEAAGGAGSSVAAWRAGDRKTIASPLTIIMAAAMMLISRQWDKRKARALITSAV